MKGLFITADDEIIIKFVVGQTKNGTVVCEANLEDMENLYGDALVKSSVEEHECVFRRPNFSDTVSMAKDIFKADGVSVDFNPWQVRFKRIVALLKSWSFEDSDGEPMPVDEDSVTKLNPAVASTVGAMLDSEIGVL